MKKERTTGEILEEQEELSNKFFARLEELNEEFEDALANERF